MAKLWQKDYDLDGDVEKYTVGDDYLLDLRLVSADCVGSAAHAEMLASIGVLSEKESVALKKALNEILGLFDKGAFAITPDQEDVHTAVENVLTEKLGDVGKKLHTCRSRNDQVILDTRLFAKAWMLGFAGCALKTVEALSELAEKHRLTPMVGRTHMQKAMPSTVGVWAGAHMESLLDDLELLKAAYVLNDQCPLGSAASYGVPVDIDRRKVSELLGFAKPQRNVLYANNGRGKIELAVMQALEQFMLDYSRVAQDLILYSMPEFGYFNLPDELTSGSSIMPQKKNPCGLELVRAKTSTYMGLVMQVGGILKGLPSGYNRDLQETKRPFMQALDIVEQTTRLIDLTVRRLAVNEEKLIAGFTPEVYATDRALELVVKGMPFRDAYREVGLNLDKLSDADPVEMVKQRRHLGTAGDLGIEEARARATSAGKWAGQQGEALRLAIKNLMGREVELAP
ncbi:MAG: argininosuccinate lyase [Planctomycetes bacterium]|nr:argininosuccinate lyase [Planctomycetota bacterium]